MPVVPVPELRKKFALLRAYSACTSWELLAEPFGASPKTLKYWGHGSATRMPDQLPAEALPVLANLFAELLPSHLADSEVRRLVLGPADRLKEELRSGTAFSFAALLAREGQTGTATIIKRPVESGMIEIEAPMPRPEPERLRLGQWFRVAFPLRAGCAYAVTLQGTQQAWAMVPSAIVRHPARTVLVPGLDELDRPRFMHERRDAGLHRFVCLQAAELFPVMVEEHLREHAILDKSGLDALAGFYARLRPGERACHVLTVAIERDAPA